MEKNYKYHFLYTIFEVSDSNKVNGIFWTRFMVFLKTDLKGWIERKGIEAIGSEEFLVSWLFFNVGFVRGFLKMETPAFFLQVSL
ncbi:hypothetical protein SAMN04488057_103113 [Cyclobacterium lianum]|uniref:Uncharacterized protein n=1 Tax=Cyclobacterium lianum TaxID=388280 RepID=A0A1M7L4U4_9BACT|nr:hypothetical protein SAMN04488057_103113 [Cyclobacterium lianum]